MEDLGGHSGGPGGPKGISGGAEGVQGATLEASENGPKNGGALLWSDGTLLGSAAVTRDPAEG